jgi:hypothetical protein
MFAVRVEAILRELHAYTCHSSDFTVLPSRRPNLSFCCLALHESRNVMQAYDDDFKSRTVAFENWLQSSGATLSDNIELADLRQQNAGRGVGIAFPLQSERWIVRADSPQSQGLI